MSTQSTIFAVSSGSGVAGITVIRVSGPAAREALVRLGSSVPLPRRLAVRKLAASRTGEVFDQAVVLWLPGPGTSTGEDMVELHVHGSSAVVNAVLQELGGIAGFRLAEPGEFTRRALVNGRVDLVEVEGLSDLLSARTDAQRRQAMFQMSGNASTAYDSWLKRMTSVLARLEAAIDFVDEAGVAEEALLAVRGETEELIAELERALAGAKRADVVRGGVRVVILGPPNAGKSSLLNRLAAREAAIVSPVAGTTRDAIEVSLVLAGLPVTITDTAGLRDVTTDEIEIAGMNRAKQAAALAHIIIELNAVDVPAFNAPESEAVVIRVLNKADLVKADSILVRNEGQHLVSIKAGLGVDGLLAALEGQIAESYKGVEAPIVVRERHVAALQESIRCLNDSLRCDSAALELTAELVRRASHALARVTGRVDVEDVLGKIFSEFCIGK